jgi:Na+-driven multidrug efflux pump
MIQTILLPAMSIGFAAGPIVGQNFGAKNGERVRETFRKAVLMGAAVMIAIVILVQWQAEALVSIFDADASAIAVAIVFLQLMSWALVPQGLVYTCSSMFQGLGNTVPSLISSGVCFFAFAIPAVWLSKQPTYRIEQVWCLLITAITLQAVVSLCLVRLEFKRRLVPIVAAPAATADEIPSVRSTLQ